MLLAPQSPSSDLPLKNNHNFIGDNAMRVRLTQNNSTLAKQNSNPNFLPFKCTNFDSPHASRVHLNQNQLSSAQHSNTFKPNTANHNFFYCAFDPRVRCTQNKLTLTRHIPLILKQPHIKHNSNALFAIHASKHQNKSPLALHITNTINMPLQIEIQIALFETQNSGRRHSLTKISINLGNSAVLTCQSQINLNFLPRLALKNQIF